MNRKLVNAVATFCAGGAAMVTWQNHREHRFIAPGHGRIAEGRVTGFDYASAAGRGARQADDHDRRDLTYTELEERVRKAPSADNLHQFALLNFQLRRSRAAEELLTRAASLRSDAAILSDLSATELELGEIADAAEHAARALEIDSSSRAAAFNWALAMDKIYNRTMARVAWEHYLDLDPGSDWAVEARQHLQRLDARRPDWKRDELLLGEGAPDQTIARLVRQYPQRARAKALNELLPAYVKSGRDAELSVIRRIAAVRAEAGDPFLHDAVEHAVVNRSSLGPGFEAFRAGDRYETAQEMEKATLEYRTAARLLRKAGSPVAIPAAIYAASSESYATDGSRRVLADLDEVDRWLEEDGNSHLSMKAESAWVRGLVHGRAGNPEECLRAYSSALADVQRIGETEHEASILSLMAAQLESVGDPSEAEQFRRNALRRLDELNSSARRMYLAYLETGLNALTSKRPRLALAFFDAAARVGQDEHNAMYIVDAEAWRALALFDAGRFQDAGAAIAAARADAPLIKDAGLIDRTLANVEFITARIESKRHPVRALEAFGAAVRIWDRFGWHFHRASTYLARGQVYAALGDRLAAERDFRAAIEDIERQRETLDEPAMRISYFERADRVFGRLIELLLDDGRTEDAFAISEKKRARALLDRIASTGRAVPLGARDIAGRVDERTSVLEFVLLDRGAELWLVRGGKITHRRSQASGPAIESAIAQHIAAVERNDAANVHRHGRWLFDQLIAPLLADIPADSDLVLIPDGALLRLPFATLVLPDQRFLVERQPLAIAPSASVFLRSSPPADVSAVVVAAQPAPGGYEVLPRAAGEAAAVRQQYTQGRVFVGADVSPSRFLDEAESATIIHFAGHAKLDEYTPARSALVFESPGGNAELLSVEMIARASLKRHPVVVLAACSTGRGKLRQNEGIDSLATAFLAAGARSVVATLSDVDDAASAQFFRTFHHQLRSGARPADALRSAQMTRLRNGKPSVWGTAVVIGEL